MNRSASKHFALTHAGNYLRRCRQQFKLRREDALDQCPATIDTVMRRLSLLSRSFDLKRLNILLLGDDDLLSLAIVAAELAQTITVLDCDLRILDVVARCTPSGFVKVIQHDLRKELPDTVRGRFDLVFTDPPYTPAGQHLFLKRAAEALREKRGSSIYTSVSRFYVRRSEIACLLSYAERAGLKLAGLYEDFNFYQSPPDVKKDLRNNWGIRNPSFFTSTLFHLQLMQNRCYSSHIPNLGCDIYTYEDTNAQS